MLYGNPDDRELIHTHEELISTILAEEEDIIGREGRRKVVVKREERKKRKQERESRKKQKRTQVKEIKFRPGTDIGDYQVKLRNLIRFLEAGDKAKVTMRFRGREHAHRERGLELLQKIESDLAEISAVEQRPMMEGRQMIMVIAPKKH